MSRENKQQKEIDKLLAIVNRKRDRKLVKQPKANPFLKKTRKRQVARAQPVFKFIKAQNWKKGKHQWNAKILFVIYLEWCKETKALQCNLKMFKKIMKLNFPYKLLSDKTLFVGINE